MADAIGHMMNLKVSETSWPRGQMMCKDVVAHEGADDMRGSTEDLSTPMLSQTLPSSLDPALRMGTSRSDLGCQDGN